MCSVLHELFNNLKLSSSKAVRYYYTVRPRFRPPPHLLKKDRALGEDYLTSENKEFIEEMIEEKRRNASLSIRNSSLAFKENEKLDDNWNLRWQRVGVLARKIGNYPLWLSNGRKVATTLLHVQDTHVVRVAQEPAGKKYQGSWVVVGTESVPPNTVTKEYASLFNEAGLLPKRHLRRFYVYPPHLAPLPATPLTAAHFTPGDVIDVAAYTKDRGFQGVMKRWGFSGMGASHGVTKTHRRPGNIGAGGNKARVWPGTKMPGHMGNRWRVARGVLVLRVDPEASVLWALGVAIPGATGALCSLYDTLLPLRRAAPHTRPLPSPNLHELHLPSITYEQ